MATGRARSPRYTGGPMITARTDANLSRKRNRNKELSKASEFIMSGIFTRLLFTGSLFLSIASRGQDSLRNNPLDIGAVCRLALENSTQLKLARTHTLFARQAT